MTDLTPLTAFIQDAALTLPDFDDDDFDEQLEIIAASDREILSQLSQFTDDLNHHEKMALAAHAVVAIDTSHTQLCTVSPTGIIHRYSKRRSHYCGTYPRRLSASWQSI